MATVTAHKASVSPLQLPTELWARVFQFLLTEHDILDLWTGCRPVSKTFKSETERLFQEKHLPKTWITFDLSVYLIQLLNGMLTIFL